MKETKKTKAREGTPQLDLIALWLRIWALIKPSQKRVIQLLFLIVFLELVRLIGPYILKLIIDRITNFDVAQLDELVWLVFAMFLFNQFVSGIDYFSDKHTIVTQMDMVTYLSKQAHKKMVFLGLGFHEKENTGSKITKINRGIDRIDNLFGNFFWDVIPTIVQVLLTTITLFWIDWRFGVLVLIFVPLFIFFTFRVNRIVYPFRRRRFDQQDVAGGLMAQSIININTVKSFVQEDREHSRFSQVIEKIRNSVALEFDKILKFNLIRNLIIDLGRGSILLFGIYLVFMGNLTVGSLVFVYTISEKSLISLFRISRLYDRLMESTEPIDRLYYLSREKAEISNAENGIKPKNLEGKIEFKKVTFAYQNSQYKALDNVSFTINSGCVTALVGPSGGGKTTVARMIYRHYDVKKGAILIDNVSLEKYDLYAFRRFISIVPQEVEIFDTSIRENIAYAKPKATLTEIKAAARIANAEEFISQQKEGYATMVGERGIKLSAGQRQRIGIARAILANPRILIFDEATSSLDSYSERLIQEAMDKISKNRTVVIIAHRLSTIKKADKIIVLEKGRVVEEGSHVELSRLDGGLYQKLIKLQAMGDVT